MYVAFLDHLERNEPVYLAVSATVFQEQFQSKAVQTILKYYQVKLIVVDDQRQEITQWIK